MYNPISSCSAFIHVLLKHPVLVIALGIIGATGMLKGDGSNQTETILIEQIESAEKVAGKETAAEASKWFQAIQQTNIGLSHLAVKDVLGKIPACQNLSQEALQDQPKMVESIAFLYFLDLINRFGDIETAVVAFYSGPTQTQEWLDDGTPLPEDYLNQVKKYL